MLCLQIAILLAVVACVFTDEDYTPRQLPGPNEAKTRHILGEKQHAVNVKVRKTMCFF